MIYRKSLVFGIALLSTVYVVSNLFAMEDSSGYNNFKDPNKDLSINEKKIQLGYDLIESLKEKDQGKAIKLILSGAEVNIVDKEKNSLNWTPLFYSCDNVNFKVTVEHLINARANINVLDKFEMTPLMRASQRGYLDIVRLLMESGADMSLVDYLKKDALSRAVENNHLAVVDYLKTFYSNLIKRLEEAISYNKFKEIEKILNTYPNLVDSDGNNALHMAAKKHNYFVFNFIWILFPQLFNKSNNSGLVAVDKYPEIICQLIVKKRLSLVNN